MKMMMKENVEVRVFKHNALMFTYSYPCKVYGLLLRCAAM